MKRIDIEPVIIKANEGQGTIRICLNGVDIFKDFKLVDEVLFREDLLIMKEGKTVTIFSISDIIYIEVNKR